MGFRGAAMALLAHGRLAARAAESARPPYAAAARRRVGGRAVRNPGPLKPEARAPYAAAARRRVRTTRLHTRRQGGPAGLAPGATPRTGSGIRASTDGPPAVDAQPPSPS
jgi:hypothetical protein